MFILFHLKVIVIMKPSESMFSLLLDETRKEIRKLLFTRCEKTEINLRKYRILGGALHFDLIYQPPQPKDMRRDYAYYL